MPIDDNETDQRTRHVELFEDHARDRYLEEHVDVTRYDYENNEGQ